VRAAAVAAWHATLSACRHRRRRAAAAAERARARAVPPSPCASRRGRGRLQSLSCASRESDVAKVGEHPETSGAQACASESEPRAVPLRSAKIRGSRPPHQPGRRQKLALSPTHHSASCWCQLPTAAPRRYTSSSSRAAMALLAKMHRPSKHSVRVIGCTVLASLAAGLFGCEYTTTPYPSTARRASQAGRVGGRGYSMGADLAPPCSRHGQHRRNHRDGQLR